MVTTGVLLRPMTDADLDAIGGLEGRLFGAQAWTRQTLEEELADPATRWYRVAECAGAIVGYAGLAMLGDEAHVMTIGTVPEHRGEGIGRAMLRELLAEAARRGIVRVILEVRADNAAAIALYQTEGFAAVGVRRRYYQPENVDAVVMIRG